MSEPIAYTVKDAATAVGVSPKSIYEAVAAEQLPAKNIGKGARPSIRISHEALVRWFQDLDDYEPPDGGR